MKKKKKEKISNRLYTFVGEEWKFILTCILITFILLYPADYMITTGGGIIDIDNRVEIEDSYKSKGSLNISFVSQLKGNILTYGLSYIIPNWEREPYSDYLIDDLDTIKDMEFRDKLDLKRSVNNATYWGFTLADEPLELKSTKLYVVYKMKDLPNKFKVGDEIISIDDEAFNSREELKEKIKSYNEGDTVEVRVINNKKERTFKTKIYKKDGEKLLGIYLEILKEYKTEKEIKFKFKRNESGPSAGLMTTLDIYNKLTKKDLTKGKKIAGTGTIEEDGTIGEIGGVDNKVIGAASNKADIFLVPEKNYKECIKTVKKNKLKIKVIKVRNIEEAIEKLKDQ